MIPRPHYVRVYRVKKGRIVFEVKAVVMPHPWNGQPVVACGEAKGGYRIGDVIFPGDMDSEWWIGNVTEQDQALLKAGGYTFKWTGTKR